MNNVEIESMRIRNFKSFGDYDTVINLSKTGPLLIIGCVDGDEGKSNGSGKSSLAEALVWCLFGRLPHIDNPGNRVVNWHTGKNCLVSVIVRSGYEITRTRKHDEHPGITITKDGHAVDLHDATMAGAQREINKLLGIDFCSFMSGVCFGQFSGSFMSLSEQKRRRVIERVFGISKLRFCAESSKNKISVCEAEIEKLTNLISEKKLQIDNMNRMVVSLRSKEKEFEENRNRKIAILQNEIKKLRENKVEMIDIDSLELEWQIILEVEKKLNDIKVKINDLNNEKSEKLSKINTIQREINNKELMYNKLENELASIKARIDGWSKMKGTVCPTCGQPVDASFVDKKVAEIIVECDDRVEQIKSDLLKISGDINRKKGEIVKNEEEVKAINNKTLLLNRVKDEAVKTIELSKKNKITVEAARKQNELVGGIDRCIEDKISDINRLKAESNPYTDQIMQLESEMDKVRAEIDVMGASVDKYNKTISHLKFIYKAYSDKKNIQSLLIKNRVSLLNDKLVYYFNEFNINSQMLFNELLQFDSDVGDYTTFSGGERKRIDLALMFALYDMMSINNNIKSNVLILDEIDKEFDRDGVDDYVHLIMDDLANRIESILVISHKSEISPLFPNHLRVIKRGGFSYVEQ